MKFLKALGYLALFAIPFALGSIPDLPAHGYGHIWWILPVLAFWRRPAARKRYGWYAAALVVQTLAFPDPDWGFLGWVLLIPYFLARECNDGVVWWRGAFLFGFYRAFAGYYWLGNIHFSAWIAVSFLSAIGFTFVFEWFVRRATQVPFALRVAIGWSAFEWYHSVCMGGFPWLYISHSQYENLYAIQIVDLIGAFGLSFLMAFVQAAWFTRERRSVIASVAVLAVIFGYGFWRWGQVEPPAPGAPVVAMVQTKQPHSVKRSPRMRGPNYARHLGELTREAVEAAPEANLVLWPETISPFPYVEKGALRSHLRLGFERTLARSIGKPLLAGINSYTSMERRSRGHNSAVLIREDGSVGGLYRKQRLVPMGEEFLPRKVMSDDTADRLFAWLRERGYPGHADLERGEGYTVLNAGPGLRCAVLICFEGLYPDMGRAASMQKDVDLIVHLVNNGWFEASFEQRQAVASWVMRAVETRTPFFSCANGGISCAIGPGGTILARIDRVMEEGVMAAAVPARWAESGFSRGGAYFPLIAGLAGLLFFTGMGWRRRTQKG